MGTDITYVNGTATTLARSLRSLFCQRSCESHACNVSHPHDPVDKKVYSENLAQIWAWDGSIPWVYLNHSYVGQISL